MTSFCVQFVLIFAQYICRLRLPNNLRRQPVTELEPLSLPLNHLSYFVPQIELHPTRWQYPLINHLDFKCITYGVARSKPDPIFPASPTGLTQFFGWVWSGPQAPKIGLGQVGLKWVKIRFKPKLIHTGKSRSKKLHFSNRVRFDLRNLYVPNLKTGHPKKCLM